MAAFETGPRSQTFANSTDKRERAGVSGIGGKIRAKRKSLEGHHDIVARLFGVLDKRVLGLIPNIQHLRWVTSTPPK